MTEVTFDIVTASLQVASETGCTDFSGRMGIVKPHNASVDFAGALDDIER